MLRRLNDILHFFLFHRRCALEDLVVPFASPMYGRSYFFRRLGQVVRSIAGLFLVFFSVTLSGATYTLSTTLMAADTGL